MKSWISAIFTLGGMAGWWLYATNSGYSNVADVLGLLVIGIFLPFAMEMLIPKQR
jgi:hypothetical protein